MGAVFFYLIKTTIASGRKAGFAVALGIILGDIIYVFLLLFGFSEILENANFIKWFALVGGIILVAIGISYLIKKHEVSETINSTKSSLFIHFTKGFVLNFVNPFVAAVWVGFLAINEAQFSNTASIITSLIVTLVVILSTDLLKVFYAEKLRRFLSPIVLQKVFKFLGIIMLLFGLRLLYAFF